MFKGINRATFSKFLTGVLILTVFPVLTNVGLQAAHAEHEWNTTTTAKAAPAGTFAAGAGGDGWGISVYNGKVYNIYHNSSKVLTLDCHLRQDGSPCFNTASRSTSAGWSAASYVMQNPANLGVSNSPNTFLPAYGPGQWIDEQTGMMYAYTVNKYVSGATTTYTPGVVKINLSKVDTKNLFNGAVTFYPLGTNTVDCSNSVGNNCLAPTIGLNRKVFAMNYQSSAHDGTSSPDANKLLCFDPVTNAYCAGSPYSLTGITSASNYKTTQVGVFGNNLLIPVWSGSGSATLDCFDTLTLHECTNWTPPTDANFKGNGAPFPLLSNTGSVTGVCIPDSTILCYKYDGTAGGPTLLTSTTFQTLTGGTWAAFTGAVGTGSGSRNGSALVVGTRVFIPETGDNKVHCVDYGVTTLVCQGSGGKTFPYDAGANGASSVYTVGTDSNDPTCVWLNSDSGTMNYTVPGSSPAITITKVGQIQNFDAYTGGPCGSSGIRVVLSQLINMSAGCTPNSYISLQLSTPNDPTFTSGFSGTVSYLNGSGTQLKTAAGADVTQPAPQITDTGTVLFPASINSLATGVIPTVVILLKHGGADYGGDIYVSVDYTTPLDACAPPGYSVAPYEITFDPNGPTGSDGTVFLETVTQGSALSAAVLESNTAWSTTVTTGKPTSDPNWAGHTPFLGWFTSPTGGSAFDSTRVVRSNTTYYGHWTSPQWIITYDANGGTPTSETDTVDQGSALSTGDLPPSYGGQLPQYTYSGYVLSGWYETRTGGSPISINTIPSGATTYYAHWATAATVTTNAATSITKTTATINGNISGVTPSDAFFCFDNASFTASSVSWDPTATPSADCNNGDVETLTAGTSPRNYSFNLTGLTAGTTYYFMQVGIQSGTVITGILRQFTTDEETTGGGGGGGGGGYVAPTTPTEPEKKDPEKKDPEKKGTVQNQAPVNIPTTPNQIVPITQVVTIPVDPNSQVQAVIVNGKETKEITTPTEVRLPTIVGPKDKVEVVVNENGTQKVVPVAYIPNPITLANINFDFSSAKLTPKAKAILDNVAKVVKAHGFTYVDLSGHTDVFASAGFDNQKLSDNRSSAAKVYLLNKLKGLNVTIDTTGHAATKQVIASTEAKARAVNRRVEIIVK